MEKVLDWLGVKPGWPSMIASILVVVAFALVATAFGVPVSPINGVTVGAVLVGLAVAFEVHRLVVARGTRNSVEIKIIEWQSANALFKLHNQSQLLARLQMESRLTPEGTAILNKWQSDQADAEKEWTRDNPYPTK